MADTFQQVVAKLDGQSRTARTWSFIKDGPPLALVAVIFAALLALWLAPGAPGMLAVLLIAALLFVLVAEFPRWAGHLLDQAPVGKSDPIPLTQRLDDARARQIEQDRWR
jgi:hypothetical protein